MDAGKSTLMGNLLYKLGNVPKKVMHKYGILSAEYGVRSAKYGVLTVKYGVLTAKYGVLSPNAVLQVYCVLIEKDQNRD